MMGNLLLSDASPRADSDKIIQYQRIGQKQAEKVDTSYPASEIHNYSEEPSEEAVQGELLDY